MSEISGRPPEDHEEDVLVLWAAVHGLVALADGGRIQQPIDRSNGPVDRVLNDALSRVHAR